MKEEEGKRNATVEAFTVAERNIQELKKKLLEEEREREKKKKSSREHTMARYLFKLRKTSCLLMERSLAMSSGSSRPYRPCSQPSLLGSP